MVGPGRAPFYVNSEWQVEIVDMGVFCFTPSSLFASSSSSSLLSSLYLYIPSDTPLLSPFHSPSAKTRLYQPTLSPLINYPVKCIIDAAPRYPALPRKSRHSNLYITTTIPYYTIPSHSPQPTAHSRNDVIAPVTCSWLVDGNPPE